MSTLEKLNEIAAAVEAERPCWRCGAGRHPPTLDEMVTLLRAEHQARSPVFWATYDDGTWADLRAQLQEGDVLAICRNTFQIFNPYYSAALVLRDGKLIQIPLKRRGEK